MVPHPVVFPGLVATALLFTSLEMFALGDPGACGGLANDNCLSCTALNPPAGQARCGWCVNKLECVPNATVCANAVDIPYKCKFDDATPTLYKASTSTGPVNGSFALELSGTNFGVLAKSNESSDPRRLRVVRVGPFNCTPDHQSDVSTRTDPSEPNYPYQVVNCSNLPGVGYNLTTCVETRGSDLCGDCGFDPEKGHNTCPDWTQKVVQNPNFTYATPNLTNATADCLEKLGGTCMVRAGFNLTLTGVNFAVNQSVIDAYNTKVISPTGSVRWDPEGRKGTEARLGDFPCMLPYHVVNQTMVVCSIGYGTGKHLNLSLEVGGVTMSGNGFGYFQYQPPNISTIHPQVGPSYGEQLVTLTGRGFGPDRTQVLVVWASELRNQTVEPVFVSDTLIHVLSPSSHSDNQTFWNVSVIAGGQASNGTCSGTCNFQMQSCKESCNPTKVLDASGSCDPPGMCQCIGVFSFVPTNGSCLCDATSGTNPCMNGSPHCGTNECACNEQWTKSSAEPPLILEVCDVCSLSCSTLQKKVNGGGSCHCTFNKLHLIWIIGAPLLILLLAIIVWRRRAQKSEASQIKADEEFTEPLAGIANDAEAPADRDDDAEAPVDDAEDRS